MDENRIVLIRGTDSEWYEQAIFILKSPGAAKAKNLVAEAEKIINNYMLSGKITSPKIEQYKKSIMQRTARSGANAVSREALPVSYPSGLTTAKKTATRKLDYTSFFINICLVLSSLLLGYLLHKAMTP